jgi:hypothetical protein
MHYAASYAVDGRGAIVASVCGSIIQAGGKIGKKLIFERKINDF